MSTVTTARPRSPLSLDERHPNTPKAKGVEAAARAALQRRLANRREEALLLPELPTTTPQTAAEKSKAAKAALQTCEARGQRVVFKEDGRIDPKVMSASGAQKWMEWYGKDATCEIEILPVTERSDMPELYMVECRNADGRYELYSGMIFSYTDAATYCTVLARNGMETRAYRILTVVALEEPTAFEVGRALCRGDEKVADLSDAEHKAWVEGGTALPVKPAKRYREAAAYLSDKLGCAVKV